MLLAVTFYLFALLAVLSGFVVVTRRNPIASAVALVVCFFFLAGMYVMMDAHFVAIIQLLVYAGAIMVLFVFVIMLVENRDEAIVNPALGQRLGVPLKLAGVALVAFALLSGVRRAGLSTPEDLPTDFGSVSSVGHEFFDNFLFHFEVTSVLLLVGIVGAVVISKRRKPQA